MPHMGDRDNPFYNASGYPDPVACKAVSAVALAEADADSRAHFLIKVLKFIVAGADFELLARIELKDRKTGRLYK